MLPTARLAEVLAILTVDLIGVLYVDDRTAALQRLANRCDGHGRTRNGSTAAAMLGEIGGALMRLGL